jgi:hypothetical protein
MAVSVLYERGQPDCYRPHSARIAGQRSRHGAAVSNAAEARNTRASSSRRPTICSPTGRPSWVKPAGTVAAGCPVKSSRDLLEQGSAGVIALLKRANQARLAALEVGNASLEHLHSRFPGRDLVTGDLGQILGEQGPPLGAEQAPGEELQHATQQHIPADQHAGGMLGLPIGGPLPANAARRLAGVIEVVAAGLASELATHPATAQLTGDQ